jgi:hypothetical protein
LREAEGGAAHGAFPLTAISSSSLMMRTTMSALLSGK